MHVKTYFQEVEQVARAIDVAAIEKLATELKALRERGGRLFFLGVGGSAGNCGHAVNDFRKLCGIEAYAPTDNVSELTARTNDEGWETVFAAWLRTSRAGDKDAVFVFSVDGGYTKKVGDCVILVPAVAADRVTPHTEAFQAVVWHCLVSHPALQQIKT